MTKLEPAAPNYSKEPHNGNSNLLFDVLMFLKGPTNIKNRGRFCPHPPSQKNSKEGLKEHDKLAAGCTSRTAQYPTSGRTALQRPSRKKTSHAQPTAKGGRRRRAQARSPCTGRSQGSRQGAPGASHATRPKLQKRRYARPVTAGAKDSERAARGRRESGNGDSEGTRED